MSKERVRIKLKAYEHRILVTAAAKIVETVKRTGGTVSGPVPLPTEIEKYIKIHVKSLKDVHIKDLLTLLIQVRKQ